MGARKEARDKMAMRRQLEDEQKADPGFHYRGIITQLENDLTRSKAQVERLRVELRAVKGQCEELVIEEKATQAMYELERKRRQTLKSFLANMRTAVGKDCEQRQAMKREINLLMTIIRHSMSPEDYHSKREIFSE